MNLDTWRGGLDVDILGESRAQCVHWASFLEKGGGRDADTFSINHVEKTLK